MRPGLVLGITPDALSFGEAGLTVATSNFNVWAKAAEVPRQIQIANRRNGKPVI
jgi:hypothetical protein